MKLYLVRHGESNIAASDDERPLSKKGMKDITSLANFLGSLKLHVSYVFHSHKVRAKQTAEILSSKIFIDEQMETRTALDPSAPIEKIYDEIMMLNKDIMLVGHMPFMGKFVAQLITGNENRDIVLFQAGTLVCLENIGNEWVIHWMLSPELFNV